MPSGKDSNILPFENGEEFVQWAGLKFAENIISGLAGAIVGEIIEAIFGNPVDELLKEAVEEFSKKVQEGFDKEALRRAQVNLNSLFVGIEEVKNDINTLGPDWWKDIAGEIEIERIMHLDKQSRDLMEDLETLKLPGWESYMMGAGLRLNILSTLMKVPGREINERKNMENAIDMYLKHHWNMCWELRNPVWASFGPIKFIQRFGPGSISLLLPPGVYFEVDAQRILYLLRLIGVSDEDWLTRMPPIGDLYLKNINPEKDPGFLAHYFGDPDGLWFHIPRWSTSFKKKVIIYLIPDNRGASEEIRKIIMARKNGLLFWIWSHYIPDIIGNLHDISLEWMKISDPNKIKTVAIRGPGKVENYVTALYNSSKGYLGNLYIFTGNIRPSAIFQLITLKDNAVALYAKNKQYVAAELDEELRGLPTEGELVANKNWIGSWETFRLVDLGNGKVAFCSTNGKFVSASSREREGGAIALAPKLIANSSSIGQDETFEIVYLSNGNL